MAKNKHIKAVIYGEPGVGKSTFAFGAPKPFFITTDGNYEFLVDYNGADENAHKQVYSWAEAKRVFEGKFDGYETIVVDLLEDLYAWADAEFCKAQNIEHIGDLAYGKGYKMLENDFFIAIQKLLAREDKNVIFLMHGTSEVKKDRKGVEYVKYGPSKRVRDVIINQIEGRVRFFIRAYAQLEEENGKVVAKRYLSLAPDGTTEYGITRGLNGDFPSVIPLDWNAFYNTVTASSATNAPASSVTTSAPAEENAFFDDAVVISSTPAVAPAPAPAVETEIETETETAVESKEEKIRKLKEKKAKLDAEKSARNATPIVAETPEEASETATEVPQTMSAEEKLAAMKAKINAVKASQKNRN